LVVASPACFAIALLSHYVLDALPHYKPAIPEDKIIKTEGFRRYLMVEAILCFIVVAVLFAVHPVNWLVAAICAFLAAAPDLFSYSRYKAGRAGRKVKPNLYTTFASKIQWFERPIGGVVEAVWFISAIVILANILLT